MQVKKFEAKTMKNALEMVKGELGPDAIILSVKDNNGGFGLLSQESVEITAAISEKALLKKQIAEKRMASQRLDQYKGSSAAVQKKYINSVYDRITENHAKEQSKTKARYIDIDEADSGFEHSMTDTVASTIYDQEVMGNLSRPTTSSVERYAAMENVSTASQQALSEKSIEVMGGVSNQVDPKVGPENDPKEVHVLKEEISRLNRMIADFQKVPQSFISVHPGANRGVSYEFSHIFTKLKDVGVSEDTIVGLIDDAKVGLKKEDHNNRHLIDAFIAQRVLDTTTCCDRSAATKTNSRIHVFVGPSGQGKTSSLVKMASKLVIEENKKVAIITADTLKVGGIDQLKIFSQILNVPFAVLRRKGDWRYLLENLKDYDHLLLDFPSLQLKDGNELSLAQNLMPPKSESSVIHFVASVTARAENTFELGRRYRALQINDVIFTGLDETVQHGLIYDFHKKISLPIHSFGIGPKIPEDYEYASKERVLDLLFKLT